MGWPWGLDDGMAVVGMDGGMAVGIDDGMVVGVADGMAVGVDDGMVVGVDDGMAVGVEDRMAVGVADGMAVGLDHSMAVGLDNMIAVGDVGLDFLALQLSLLALDLRPLPLAALEFLLALAPAGQSEQAPIKMVNGHSWSPGIYWALRLLGRSLDIAWERALICSLTFNL